MSTVSFDDLCKGLESQIEKLSRRKRLTRRERHHLNELHDRLDALHAPPVAAPQLRMAIRKDEERWILTATGVQYRNEYTCMDQYREDGSVYWPATAVLRDLMDDILAGHTCHLCGAPLWQTAMGFVVCSKHWGHYPQPNAGDYQETHGYHTTTPPKKGHLPVIHHGRLPPAVSHPENLAAWIRAHLDVETVDETIPGSDYKKTFTRYTVRTPTKAQRTRRFNRIRKEVYARINTFHMLPEYTPTPEHAGTPHASDACLIEFNRGKRVNGNGHVPPELSVRYADYVHLMTDNKLQPRPFADWEAATRAARARQMQVA